MGFLSSSSDSQAAQSVGMILPSSTPIRDLPQEQRKQELPVGDPNYRMGFPLPWEEHRGSPWGGGGGSFYFSFTWHLFACTVVCPGFKVDQPVSQIAPGQANPPPQEI